jgi:hypothetical protein
MGANDGMGLSNFSPLRNGLVFLEQWGRPRNGRMWGKGLDIVGDYTQQKPIYSDNGLQLYNEVSQNVVLFPPDYSWFLYHGYLYTN